MYHYLHYSPGASQHIMINLDEMEITDMQPNVNGWFNIGRTKGVVALINLSLFHVSETQSEPACLRDSPRFLLIDTIFA